MDNFTQKVKKEYQCYVGFFLSLQGEHTVPFINYQHP